MQTTLYTTYVTRMLADTYTPVSVYMKLRDVYPKAVLLESTDYRAADNSFSYLCFNPLAEITWTGKKLFTTHGMEKSGQPVSGAESLYTAFENFRLSFKESAGMNSIA